MSESKIDATHRLHKSGQWYEASIFRDAERKRFREQGMTRAEAGDAAWASMIQEYPSPEDEMEQLLDTAFQPPWGSRNFRFMPTWFALHTLKALSPFVVDGQLPADKVDRALAASPEWSWPQIWSAIHDPRKFIDDAKREFEREIEERRSPPSAYDEEVAVTMEEHIEWLPQLAAALTPPPTSLDGSTEPDENSAPVETAAV